MRVVSTHSSTRPFAPLAAHRSCRLQLHQAWGRDGTEIKILGDLLLQMIDQGNLINSPQQVI